MAAVLSHRLAKESEMTQREMINYIREEFGEEVSATTISRTLKKRRTTLKVMRRVAQQQVPDLQHFYYHRLKMMGSRSYHYIFIDESGFDRSGMFRKKGWAPKGITPVQKARFERGPRVQLIAAYTQRGVKLSRFFSGSMDRPLFEDFIEQLLCHCGRWPEPETILIMDNVGFHYSDRVKQMCADAGVKLDFTAPYTPRTDPIEEFFGEVKTQVKFQRTYYKGLAQRDFEAYVKCCVEAVGSRRESAEGHFRNAGLYVEQPPE